MTNYQQRLDAETWAFIDKTNSFYPVGMVDLTLGEQRTLYDRMCRAFHAGHPQGVSAETSAIETPARAIPIRRYRAGQGDRRALPVGRGAGPGARLPEGAAHGRPGAHQLFADRRGGRRAGPGRVGLVSARSRNPKEELQEGRGLRSPSLAISGT